MIRNLLAIQVSEFAGEGTMILYDAHSDIVAANLTVMAALEFDNNHHNLARPFWLHGNLAGLAATVDLRVMNWRCT